MEIEVLEKTDTRLKFALHGASHTFCNNLKRELYGDKAVDVAAYKIDHPLLGTPLFIIQKTNKTASFKKILQDAAERVKKHNAETRKLVKALKA